VSDESLDIEEDDADDDGSVTLEVQDGYLGQAAEFKDDE
jgi:hypothetical protein